MLKALLIDDEDHCLNRLETLLRHHCADTIQVVGKCQTIDDALAAIQRLKPDLLFLDVELNGNKTCFNLLGGITEIDFDVIFVTAHENYAYRAIKANAIDYLLKPVIDDQLIKAVEKAVRRTAKDRTEHQLTLAQAIVMPVKKVEHIKIPTKNGRVEVELTEIVFCESDGGYTKFWGVKKTYLGMITEPLHTFQDLFKDSNFYRIHNSYLINLSHWESYINGRGGAVKMKDGTQLKVAEQRRMEFKRRLQTLGFRNE